MTIQGFYFDGFNENCPYSKYFIELKDNTYIFTVRWIDYCKSAFLSISDYEDNPIISGLALSNKLKIRHNKLPYTFFFLQENNESYEPTIDNISKEFVLVYDNEETV